MDITIEKRLDARKRPNETPIMHQEWKDLLFLHWRCNPEDIQKTLPPGLFVDTFDGDAFVTITPFYMENVSFLNFPMALPGINNFNEINVRTYVYDRHGNPGIWFYSLDINSLMASKGAQLTFFLPYHHAEITLAKKNDSISINGMRVGSSVAFDFDYSKTNKNTHLAEPGTLEFFLIERYTLFSFSSNQLYMGKVSHAPYPLTKASVTKSSNSLLKANALPVANTEAELFHYSSGVNVDIYSIKKV